MTIKLFSINLRHEYYDSGLMDAATVVASSATQAFFDRHNLLSRQQTGSYSVYYFGNLEVTEFKSQLANLIGQTPLRFRILSDRQNFLAISKLPLDWYGLIKYSSRNSQPSDAESRLLLADLGENEFRQDGVVGEIAVYAEDIAVKGNLEAEEFDIQITARKTQWDYFLINNSNASLSNPEIKNKKGESLFYTGSVTLANGQNALHFTSAEKHYPLSESNKAPFSLIDHVEQQDPLSNTNLQEAGVQQVPSKQMMNHQGSKTVLEGLPIPSCDQLNIKSTDGQVYACSEMYVYL